MRTGSMLPPIFSSGSFQRDGLIFEHHRQPAFSVLPQSFLGHTITIRLDGPSNVELSCGQKRMRRRLTRGDVSIVPARYSIDGVEVEACEFLQVCLNPSVVDRAAKELGLVQQVELVPVLGVVDPLAEETIYQLDEEMGSGLGTRGYVNVLVDTLAAHLVRYYTESTWTSNNVGGFPKYILDRTLEYIDSVNDPDLSVNEIAEAVAIKPERFEQAFRAATGKSIHHYLKQR